MIVEVTLFHNSNAKKEKEKKGKRGGDAALNNMHSEVLGQPPTLPACRLCSSSAPRDLLGGNTFGSQMPRAL